MGRLATCQAHVPVMLSCTSQCCLANQLGWSVPLHDLQPHVLCVHVLELEAQGHGILHGSEFETVHTYLHVQVISGFLHQWLAILLWLA